MAGFPCLAFNSKDPQEKQAVPPNQGLSESEGSSIQAFFLIIGLKVQSGEFSYEKLNPPPTSLVNYKRFVAAKYKQTSS